MTSREPCQDRLAIHRSPWVHGCMGFLASFFILVISACGSEPSGDGRAAVATSTLPCDARPDVCYSIKDLGPVDFEGLGTQTLGINVQGTVVGTTFRWTGDRSGFIYERGTLSRLGDLGGGLSDARAVNAWGYAVGGSRDAAGNYRAVSFFKGKVTDLGTLDGTNSWAMDVNSLGLAVGNAQVSGIYHASAFFLGRAFDLGTLGYDAYANGVNDLGDVVGTGHKTADGPWTAFLYRRGKMTELGTIGGVPGDSTAEKINIHGTVCGHAAAPSGYHGFLYSHGERTDLGDFGGGWSFCVDVSDQGKAVGVASYDGYSATAFLWRDSAEGLIDLNTRIPNDKDRVYLAWGSGINSAGQITVYGFNPLNFQGVEGYLLSPMSCPRQ